MRRVLSALSAAAMLAAGGCAAKAEEAPISVAAQPGSAPEAKPSGSAPAEPAPVVVPATLRFTGKTLDGAGFDAATMAGKPTILWFWAPWCATCASEAQSISDLATEYRGRLGILGIAGLGDNKAMHEFVSDLDVGNVPHLDDQAGKIWKRFKITQQSTYVFLDGAGKVVRTGYLDDLQLTEQVESMVA